VWQRLVRAKDLIRHYPVVGVNATGEWDIFAKDKDARNAFIDSLVEPAAPAAAAPTPAEPNATVTHNVDRGSVDVQFAGESKPQTRARLRAAGFEPTSAAEDAWTYPINAKGTSKKYVREHDRLIKLANEIVNRPAAAATEGPSDDVYSPTTTAADALARLQESGVVYGPRGIRVRVLPTRQEGRFELEITERGQRRFEGMDPTLEEAQATGAQRLPSSPRCRRRCRLHPKRRPATRSSWRRSRNGPLDGRADRVLTAKPTKGKKGPERSRHAQAPGAADTIIAAAEASVNNLGGGC
jgi:hypothetical protein